MTAQDDATPAPRQVVVASGLYLANAAVALAGVGVTVATLPSFTPAGLIGAGIAAAVAVLTAVFAVQLRRGRGWARTVLTVFAVLDLLGALVLLLPHVPSPGDPLAVAQLATSGVAAVLTFHPHADAWIRARNPPLPGS